MDNKTSLRRHTIESSVSVLRPGHLKIEKMQKNELGVQICQESFNIPKPAMYTLKIYYNYFGRIHTRKGVKTRCAP